MTRRRKSHHALSGSEDALFYLNLVTRLTDHIVELCENGLTVDILGTTVDLGIKKMAIEFAVDGSQVLNGRNPAAVDKPWPRIVVALLAITGLISPILCFVAAPVAFALSDQDDGFLLTGIGGAHLLLSWALFAAV